MNSKKFQVIMGQPLLYVKSFNSTGISSKKLILETVHSLWGTCLTGEYKDQMNIPEAHNGQFEYTL